ncbi:MAG: CDP-alcohol phosphatidyltransferase family protein [Asticcacaulis sp.]
MKIANLFTGLRVVLMVPLLIFLIRGDAWPALIVFALAGLSDIADGYLARKLNQASRFGAFFDLLADRLLTLTLFSGLLTGGLPEIVVASGVILLARDFLVAGLNEALPDQLHIRVSPIERAKIALQFLGFGLLILPEQDGFIPTGPDSSFPFSTFDAGALCLCLSAALCLMTVGDYVMRARQVFKAE